MKKIRNIDIGLEREREQEIITQRKCEKTSDQRLKRLQTIENCRKTKKQQQ